MAHVQEVNGYRGRMSWVANPSKTVTEIALPVDQSDDRISFDKTGLDHRRRVDTDGKIQGAPAKQGTNTGGVTGFVGGSGGRTAATVGKTT